MRPKTESLYKAVKTSRESVRIRITGKKKAIAASKEGKKVH
jgi:hypothetical protein